MKFSRYFNFAGFFNNFWILRHLNLAVEPKYYISRHFNFAVWTKYYNFRHFSFAVVSKIGFFMCVSFQHFRNFENIRYLIASLNTFLSCFTHQWFPKVLKVPENLLSGLEISLFSSSEFRESSRKAKHEKCIFVDGFFHRWVFQGFSRGILTFRFGRENLSCGILISRLN